ncbi:MAG: CAP domain-containing protein, partial [Myxococcota bacterium]|nr:CAP domain-containing protein [Myxococcota bacterium]
MKSPAAAFLLAMAVSFSACSVGDGDGDGTHGGSNGTETGQTDTDSDIPAGHYEQARQACVNQINTYRATVGLAALSRWTGGESCADAEAKADSLSGEPHGAFGSCGELAQNECPGWGSVDSIATECLAVMWAEGPGDDFLTHGHYINMTTPTYTMVACGFFEGQNGVWAVQN